MSTEHFNNLLAQAAIELPRSEDAPRSFAETETANTGPSAFDIALANLLCPTASLLEDLFHTTDQRGQPPSALRAMLAGDYWQAIATPPAPELIAGLERTRAFAVHADGSASVKKKKHLRPGMLPNAQNCLAFLVCDSAPATTDQQGIALTQTPLAQLAALGQDTQFILLQHANAVYTFSRAQYTRLQALYQQRAERQQRSAQEAHDLAVLAGAGSLADFLALRVRVDAALQTVHGHWGLVIAVQTLQFSGRIHLGKLLTINELAQQLINRTDFDGLEFNAHSDADPVMQCGPNFASDCLNGVDPRSNWSAANRQFGFCPAAAIVNFPHAEYRTRFFTRLDDQDRHWLSERLQEATTLRAAIAPDQAALPRSAVRSTQGAYALRTHAQFAERAALDRFIARLQRALRTRWRIGIY